MQTSCFWVSLLFPFISVRYSKFYVPTDLAYPCALVVVLQIPPAFVIVMYLRRKSD